MTQRVGVAIAGLVIVSAYAALMIYDDLVLDPRAAVPGETLEQIYDHLHTAGANVTFDVMSILVSAAVGVVLALGVAAMGIGKRLPSGAMVAMFLIVLAFGAVPTFANGFAVGMDVADAYGVGGGAHTVWSILLYLVSLGALISLAPVVAVSAKHGKRLLPQPS